MKKQVNIFYLAPQINTNKMSTYLVKSLKEHIKQL